MNIPEWVKPGLFGAALGAGGLAMVGFAWGGWETSSGTDRIARDLSNEAVVTALVPICLDQSQRDLNRARVMDALSEEPTYRQRDLIMESGWATVPGADGPDRGLAQACAEALRAESS